MKFKIYRNAIENESYNQDAIVDEDKNIAICYFINNEQKEQYLKLIEQAPNLLKNLRYMVDAWEDVRISGRKDIMETFMDYAKKAIKEATEI